jgi:SsrA-binding protein
MTTVSSAPGAPRSRSPSGQGRRGLPARGAHISPPATASTHVNPDPLRKRKLLLLEKEINKLIGKVERAGYALVPLNLHFAKGRGKLDVGFAKGKKQFDKRDAEKEKDWERAKARLMRNKG